MCRHSARSRPSLSRLLFPTIVGALLSATLLASARQQDDVEKVLRSNATQFLASRFVTNPPVCKLGAVPNANYVSAVEPWAELAGLLSGDRLLSIDGKAIGDDFTEVLPRTIPTSGVIRVEVARGAASQKIDLPCKDPAIEIGISVRMMQSINKGDWRGCVDQAGRLIAVFGRPISGPLRYSFMCSVRQVTSGVPRI